MRGRGTYGCARTFRTTSMPGAFLQLDVRDDDVRPQLGDRFDRVLRRLGKAHDFESAHRTDVFDDPLADQLGVFDDEDA